MSDRLLLRGGCVLTLDSQVGNLRDGDVLVENGRIAEIGTDIRARDAEIVEATDTIVMPGFVDAHRHVWKSLFRNLGQYGENVSDAALGPHHQPDDIYAATLIGLLGAVASGVTTVVDWADIPLDGASIDAALQAHADAGVRTVFAPAAARWAEDPGDLAATLRRLAGRSSDPSTTIASGPGDVTRAELDELSAQWAVARELGLRIHAHAGMNEADQGALSELGSKNLLGDDVTLIHCSNLSDADLDAVAAAGAAVALTPSTEMAAGIGRPPVQELIDRSIRPGLGVDDERLAPGDMLAQMRTTISLQHATYFDLKLAGKAGLPNLLTTREVILYATGYGAAAAGLADTVGSLAPGRAADLIVLRTDRPNIYPINDPIGAIVWGVDTSNLDWVLVGGRVLMRNGELAADIGRTRDLAAAARDRIAGAAGLLTGTGGPS